MRSALILVQRDFESPLHDEMAADTAVLWRFVLQKSAKRLTVTDATTTTRQTSESAGRRAPAFVSLPSPYDIHRHTSVLTSDLGGSWPSAVHGGAWMSTSDDSVDLVASLN